MTSYVGYDVNKNTIVAPKLGENETAVLNTDNTYNDPYQSLYKAAILPPSMDELIKKTIYPEHENENDEIDYNPIINPPINQLIDVPEKKDKNISDMTINEILDGMSNTLSYFLGGKKGDTSKHNLYIGIMIIIITIIILLI